MIRSGDCASNSHCRQKELMRNIWVLALRICCHSAGPMPTNTVSTLCHCFLLWLACLPSVSSPRWITMSLLRVSSQLTDFHIPRIPFLMNKSEKSFHFLCFFYWSRRCLLCGNCMSLRVTEHAWHDGVWIPHAFHHVIFYSQWVLAYE